MFTIYGDIISGNCLKVKYVADYLDLDYTWHPIDVVAGEAQKAEFKAINPAAQVPTITFDDGKMLSQSNAIMRYLARKSDLIPNDPWYATKMDQWLFWEQYSHETCIAVTRFHVLFQNVAIEERNPDLVAKGEKALSLMDEHLSNNNWFAGSTASLADVALYAYTQFAPDAGFDLATRPNLRRWLAETKSTLKLSDDLSSGS